MFGESIVFTFKPAFWTVLEAFDILRQKHDEMKIIKKELKVKQKTLGTYEYLMRLPVEEE